MLAGMAKDRKQGKVPNFTVDQVKEIGRALTHFNNRRKITDRELAKEMAQELGMEVTQQTANNARNAKGVQYSTAWAAAKVLGYGGVDEFFEKQGVAFGQRKLGDIRGKDKTDDEKAQARRYAIAMGISDEAIDRYDKRMADKGITNQPVKRWVDGYSAEQDAITDERLAAVGRKPPKKEPEPPPPSSPRSRTK